MHKPPAVLLALLALPAHAGLGEPASAVARDHRILQGRSLTVLERGTHQVHEITLASGTRVREYVNSAGQIFGVGWDGQELPDLRQVLAGSHARYAAATAAPGRRRASHKLLVIAEGDLRLQVIKLPRGFAGVAHIPSLLPAGVATSDIR